jgi:hypothetical protein
VGHAALTGPIALADDLVDYDADADGALSADEYYGYVTDVGIYSDWDADGDGFIEDDEFGLVGLDEDWTDWDVDRNDYLDSAEMYDGIFGVYDENEDGHWDGGEWDDAGEAGIFDL